MKKFILMVLVVLLFTLPAFSFDAGELRQDSDVIGSFLQNIVNPQNRSFPQSTAAYLEGYGIVMTYSTYFNRSSGYKAEFNKNNERLVRGLALYLSAIRGLKEKERVVVVIKDTNHPYTTYTAQVENKYLLSFQKGKMRLEDLQKKIKIAESSYVEK